jgi:hypothetical protein
MARGAVARAGTGGNDVPTIWCRLCSTGYATVGEIPAKCPQCDRETKWTTSLLQLGEPLTLTEDDRRLLRGFRISTE